MDDRESFKTGAPNFFYFYHGSNKMRTTSTFQEMKYLPSEIYFFGSNFHSKPSAGMALDILAPSYVNVKVMDVWRVCRMNRWLLDGQHFITWRRETGSRDAAICYKWRWKHANKAGTRPPNGQHLYSDSTLTFFLLDISPCIIISRPAEETVERSNRRTISGELRSEDVRQHYLPGVTNVNIAPHKGWHTCHHIY